MSETDGTGRAGRRSVAGKRVGGFEIIARLGQGAMGTVFKATQLSVGRVVALKVLPPRLTKSPNFLERFLREARAAARLSHPNIVKAIDAGQAGVYYYYAMEFVDGRSARDLVESHGRLTERRALQVGRDIARALAHAHEAGVIHRDVKPDNILVAADGTCKLADLGVARETGNTDSRLTQTGMAVGTPNYISPEQVRADKTLDGRSDVYSLGATLHYLLAGLPPYAGSTAAEVLTMHLHDPPPDVRIARPDVSPATAALLCRALAKSPADRYASAAEMLEDIDRILAGHEPGTAPSGATMPPVVSGTRSGSRTWLYVAAAAVLLIAAAISFLPGGLIHNTPPAVSTEPAASPPDFLTYMRDWETKHPGEFSGAIARYTEFIEKTDNLMKKSQARDAVARLETARARAADAAFRSLSAQAARLAEAGEVRAAAAVYQNVPRELAELLRDRYSAARDAVWTQAVDRAFADLEARATAAAAKGEFDRALAVWAELPESVAGRLAPRAQAAAEAMKAKIEQHVSRVLEKAARLGDEGRPRDGLAALAALQTTKYAPRAPDCEALREKLTEAARNEREMQRRRTLAAARQKLRELHDQLDATANRPGEAVRMVEAALADKSLESVGDDIRRLARLAKTLQRADDEERASLVKRLKESSGKLIVLITADGTRSAGAVKSVTTEQVVLDRNFSADGGAHQQPDAVVKLDELSPKMSARLTTRWRPRTQTEHLAAAMKALALRDAEAAAAHLKAAEGHKLCARYQRRLNILLVGPPPRSDDAGQQASHPQPGTDPNPNGTPPTRPAGRGRDGMEGEPGWVAEKWGNPAELQIVDQGKDSKNRVLCVAFRDTRKNKVAVRLDGTWDLTAYDTLRFDVWNASEGSISLAVAFNTLPGWRFFETPTERIAPKKWTTMSIDLNAKNYKCAENNWCHKGPLENRDNVKQIILTIYNSTQEGVVYFDRVELLKKQGG
jgi:serine/threonine protein kinase